MILFHLFLKREIKNSYYSKLIILGQLGLIFSHLILYWFTSKAFAPKFDMFGVGGNDYFTFLVVGDALATIPILLLSSFTDNIRMSVVDGSFDFLLTQKTPFEKALILMSSANISIHSIKLFVTIVLAYLFFELNVSAENFVYVALLTLLSAPLFLGIGIFAASLVIFFGRGEGILGLVSTFFLVTSGAFFPLSVFPSWIQTILKFASPYSTYVYEGRRLLSLGFDSNWINNWLSLLVLGIIILPLAILALRSALNFQRRRGTPLIFTN